VVLQNFFLGFQLFLQDYRLRKLEQKQAGSLCGEVNSDYQITSLLITKSAPVLMFFQNWRKGVSLTLFDLFDAGVLEMR
jgi:hypothetical protein